MQEPDDVKLMQEVQQGRTAAFETLYRRHADRLYGYFWRSTLTREISEELVQETFLKLYRYRESYAPRASFKTYLYTVARSVLLNNWRSLAATRLKRADGVDAADTAGSLDTEESVASRQLAQQVADALERLPERQRTAIILVRYDGLSYEEAAGILGISEKAMKSLLNRARQELLAQVSP